MAIDLGRKRSGIAVTDPLQIIANGLTTVESHKLVDFVLDYVKREEVEKIVIGEPKDMKNNPSDCSKYIEPIVNRLKKLLPASGSFQRKTKLPSGLKRLRKPPSKRPACTSTNAISAPPRAPRLHSRTAARR